MKHCKINAMPAKSLKNKNCVKRIKWIVLFLSDVLPNSLILNILE